MSISDVISTPIRSRSFIHEGRRGAVAALAIAALVGVAVFSPSVAEAASPVSSGSAYGPDGTHWPSNTPRVTAARVVNVAASWTAISAAITANAGSADPVVICVAPGTIAGGNGASSTSTGVLQNIGNAARASRILVAPCSGIGTVRVAAGSGVAFVGVRGVSIVGIDFTAQPVMIRNSESFAIGYSKLPGLLITANGGNGVRNVEIVEIVAGPQAGHGVASDRAEVKSAGGYSVVGLRFAGFYAAPNYKPNGSSAHSDTLQFVVTSGNGTISNVTIQDSVLFQSADQGIMAGANSGGAIIHSAFFGGTVGQLRYPMYAGGDPIRLSNMLHGTWSSVSAADSIVAGSISSSFTFTGVVGSMSTAGARGFAALGTLTRADIDRLAPMPTDARLASIWASALRGGGPVVTPVAPTKPIVPPVVPTTPTVQSVAPTTRTVPPAPSVSSPVYGFWSPVYKVDLFTVSVAVRDHIVRNNADIWTYKGIRNDGQTFSTFATKVPGSVPYYRLWSDSIGGDFYTASATLKQHMMDAYADNIWRYEGVAFYAYPVSTQ